MTKEQKPAGFRFLRMRFMVYPRFQLTLIAVNAAILVFGFIGVFFFVSRSLERLQWAGRAILKLPPSDNYYAFMDQLSSDLYTNIIFVFIAVLAISFFVSLFFSHRMVGPILRAFGFFRRLGETGEYKEKLGFRKGDFFDELPPVVNHALDRLQKK